MEKVSHAPVRRLCCKDMGSEVPSIEASCGMLMMWDKYLIESRVGIEGSILPCNKVQFYAEGQKKQCSQVSMGQTVNREYFWQ